MTDVSVILAEVAEFEANYEAQRKALVEKLRPNITGIFAPFFAECPNGAVAFTAYTPYFNDGDECEFSVNDLAFHTSVGGDPDEDAVNGDDEDFDVDGNFYWEGDISVESYMRDTQTAEQNRIADIALACRQTFNQIPDDMIKDMLGDHIAVIIRPDNIMVEEYDHD